MHTRKLAAIWWRTHLAYMFLFLVDTCTSLSIHICFCVLYIYVSLSTSSPPMLSAKDGTSFIKLERVHSVIDTDGAEVDPLVRTT